MLIAVILLMAVLLFVLERKWIEWSQKAVKYLGSCDKRIAEPGEKVRFTAELENHSKYLVTFTRLTVTNPNAATYVETKEWAGRPLIKSFRSWHVVERMDILPHHKRSFCVDMSFSHRGCYQVGKVNVEVGDLLGIKEASDLHDAEEIVIIPEHTRNKPALDAFGGFLGDISVRRFLYDDPVLTLGFRDYSGRDPMKSISWTQTAKAGKLQVKVFDHTAELNAVVMLNVEGATEEEFEEIMRVARTVCQQLEQKKIPYGVCTNGDLTGQYGKVFSFPAGLGDKHFGEIMYALGKAERICYYSFR